MKLIEMLTSFFIFEKILDMDSDVLNIFLNCHTYFSPVDGGYAPIRNSRIEEEEDEEDEEEEEEEETLSGAVLSSHANYLASHFLKLKYRFSVELNVRQKGPRYSGGCHLMVRLELFCSFL